MNDFDQDRMENSIKCCEILKEYFKKYPMVRFWQGVEHIKLILSEGKDFNEEPNKTLNKLEKFINDTK
jgi:hypothetical protein